MTQKELAGKVQVTEAAMSYYINGTRVPRSQVLARIALALEVSSDYLMEGLSQSSDEEIGYAKRLLARNAGKMTKAEKKEIIDILLGE